MSVPDWLDPHWLPLVYATLLLVLALVLLVLEFFIVSLGLISVAALVAAAAAVYQAFQLGPIVGVGFCLLALLLAALILRWGFTRLRASTAVPKAQIQADAGYRHVAERLGVTVGAVGMLVTPARPTGRARFAGGECDVQTRNLALERGAQVVVEQIDGPVIFVSTPPVVDSNYPQGEAS